MVAHALFFLLSYVEKKRKDTLLSKHRPPLLLCPSSKALSACCNTSYPSSLVRADRPPKQAIIPVARQEDLGLCPLVALFGAAVRSTL